MMIKLLLLFTLIPLLELTLLIELGARIGLSATLAVVIATGVLGAVLAKSQGLGLIQRIREEISSGRIPADALLDGVLILGGGLLLLTPGLITDALGFAGLIPLTRKMLKDWLSRRIRQNIEFNTIRTPREE